MRPGNAVRVVDVNRDVRVRAAKVNRHAHSGFGIGDALHTLNDVLAAPLKFALELGQGRIAMLAIQIIEGAAGDDGDASGNQRDREQQREHEADEEPGTKRHDLPLAPQTLPTALLLSGRDKVLSFACAAGFLMVDCRHRRLCLYRAKHRRAATAPRDWERSSLARARLIRKPAEARPAARQ